MARPQKDEQDKRYSVRVNPDKSKTVVSKASTRCNLTLEEKAFLRTQAKAAGLSEAEFVRRRILGQAVTPKPAVVDVKKIAELLAALGRVGNNVNQLALASNRGQDERSHWRNIADELEVVMGNVAVEFDAAMGRSGGLGDDS